MSENKLLPLGGEIAMDPMPQGDITVEDIVTPFGVARDRHVLRAKVKLYDRDSDLVTEVEVDGPVGRMRRWEPSLEDRAVINGHLIAQMLVEHGLDMHDFKEIAGWALTGMAEGGKSYKYDALMVKLDQIHHQLGGIE